MNKSFAEDIVSIINISCKASKTVKLLKIAQVMILTAALINAACKTAKIVKTIRK